MRGCRIKLPPVKSVARLQVCPRMWNRGALPMMTLSSTGIRASLMRICSSAETRKRSWVKGTPFGNLVVPPV